MTTHIRLNDTIIRTFVSKQQAEHWLDTAVDSTGHIQVMIGRWWHPVLPEELVISDDDTPAPTHTNLSSHPRCPQCGCTFYHVVSSFHDHWIGAYTCGHRYMGYLHTGAKVEHCLFCAGGGFVPVPQCDARDQDEEMPCSYCQGIWS